MCTSQIINLGNVVSFYPSVKSKVLLYSLGRLRRGKSSKECLPW